MSVLACMTRAVFALGPETSLEAAARLFTAQHISGAPVVDEAGKPIGFLSTKDLVDPDRRRSATLGAPHGYRLAGGTREPIDAGPVTAPGTVADVMTTFLVSVPSSMSLDEAVQLMLASDLHRVVVVDGAQRIVGILSSLDVMRALVRRA